MTHYQPGKTYVRKILAAAPEGDAIAARRKLERALETADVHPPGLPPEAVLYIRRIRARGNAEALRLAIAEYAKSAWRPAAGTPPAAAEAIVFACRAEEMASYAVDWIRGETARRWWWRARGGEAPAVAWGRYPESVPAALERVSAAGHAAAFARSLDAHDCAALTEAVRVVHGIPLPLPASVPESWRTCAPESAAPALTAPQRLLLAFVLTLRRRPHLARQPALAEPPPIPAPPPPATAVAPPTPQAPHTAAPAPTSARLRSTERPSPSPEATPREESPQAPGTMPPERTPSTAPAPTPARTAAAPTPEPLEGRTVETRFGGLFYLINAGLFCGLYGDFTRPLEPGFALPIWDFVALAGADILGDEAAEDPVWDLLAELAGRAPGDEPGAGYEPWVWLLGWIMPALRGRLRRALGAGHDAELPPILIHHRASILITDTRLTVRLSLDELPIEIRLSGLDRDPGWVPAAGMFIAFEFN
jgi:hypothetical protein